MMTRKDYVATAKILNEFLDLSHQHDYLSADFDNYLVQPFISMFAKDNPNFDANRFWEACFDET